MAVLEIAAQTQLSSGSGPERLVPHPSLPLVAGLDSSRPAVRVWDYSAGQLHGVGAVGIDSAPYGKAIGWDRIVRTPGLAWHPNEPLLLVASEDGAVRWSPAGTSPVSGLPPAAAYRHLAFSPDGLSLWAAPSAAPGEDRWQYYSDAIDPSSGAIRTGRGWDTGIVAHPGGGLVATLQSDQGATLVLFARVDSGSAPAQMRVQRKALILDVDGYEAPVFSADGRHFAIRGNAYGQTLAVFEFPSLNRVLATLLCDPGPGFPYPQEWLDQLHAWSRRNIAFGTRPGVLWIGTPQGEIIELDFLAEHVTAHPALPGSRVTALCTTLSGAVLAATDDGYLTLISITDDAAAGQALEGRTSQDLVATFLAGTSDVPQTAAWKISSRSPTGSGHGISRTRKR